jgi:hypothetical protein
VHSVHLFSSTRALRDHPLQENLSGLIIQTLPSGLGPAAANKPYGFDGAGSCSTSLNRFLPVSAWSDS